MFANVMLAVDLAHEESWRHALPIAAELARRNDAALHVATVVPDFGMTIVAGFFPRNFEAQARAHAREALDRLVDERLGDMPNVYRLVGFGEPVDALLRLAETAQADLLVLASHQPSAVRSMVIGSMADRVVHAAAMSVMVLREPR